MQSKAVTVEQYMEALPGDRKAAMKKLRSIIRKNIPKGFKERVNYGMISYVVPHSLYPAGYHCKPQDPLSFISIASQKNFIALYHMGIYGDKKMLDWFTTNYSKLVSSKLDMGKSCIRFKKPENIPYTLIAELVSKITPADWIRLYESILNVRYK